MVVLDLNLKDKLIGKVVILGVGNTLKGDDGVGPAIARSIKGKLAADSVDCQTAPENHVSAVRKKAPDTIVIIDAVDLGLKPGSVRIVDPADIKEETFSTHGISLKTFAQFLKGELAADIVIIGIQPEKIGFGPGLSQKVSLAAENIEKVLVAALPVKEDACTA